MTRRLALAIAAGCVFALGLLVAGFLTGRTAAPESVVEGPTGPTWASTADRPPADPVAPAPPARETPPEPVPAVPGAGRPHRAPPARIVLTPRVAPPVRPVSRGPDAPQ